MGMSWGSSSWGQGNVETLLHYHLLPGPFWPSLQWLWIYFLILYMCNTMLGIHCVGVCGCQSDDSFVCFGAKPTQRACVRDLPRDRKRKREGMSQRTVGRRDQSREGQSAGRCSRDQSKEQVSQEMRVGQRGDQSTEVRKVAAGTCWPTDAGLTNTRRWVSIPSGFVEVSCKYTPTIAYKCTESCTKVSQTSPLLHLELTQARLFASLFFHLLSCVFCVLVKKCEIPLFGDEKNH